VLAPKVRGAWNIHRLTRETPLDFFVVFSSAAVLLGSRGQASHAAANAFLDALAEYRLARGLACLSINWGPWAGLTPPPPTAAGTSTGLPSGLGDVTEAQGLAVLEYLLGQRRSRAAVLPIDWPRADPELRNSAFLADFRDVSPSAGGGSEVRITRCLQDTPLEQRLDLLRDHVRGQVARILGLAPSEPLDTQAGLFDLGLDSLASLELRNRLQLDLDCPLPSTLVFNFPTVDSLTHYLASTRLTSLFATEPTTVQQSAVALAAEDLSEDEIATLLAKRLAAIT
jgi:acyl carrier protein